MTVSFELPGDVEANLRREFGDVNQTAKEAFVVQVYKSGAISLGYLAQILGLETTIQAQQWLSDRGEPLNYSIAELEADRLAHAEIFRTKG